MRSEKGVTLTSIMIYVVALTIAVATIGRLVTYFYKNINLVSDNTAAAAAYTKFNSYFTKEINTKSNDVQSCESNCIVFSKSKNQYTFQNGSIYMNKIKICKDIKACNFTYDATTKKITVELKIAEKIYSTSYTVAK